MLPLHYGRDEKSKIKLISERPRVYVLPPKTATSIKRNEATSPAVPYQAKWDGSWRDASHPSDALRAHEEKSPDTPHPR